MSNHKIKTFSDQELAEFAEVFKALANPNRLRIFFELLPLLQGTTPCTSTVEQANACQLDMAQKMGLAPSTISHHVKELRRAGLIDMQRLGKNVQLSINQQTWERLAPFFGHSAAAKLTSCKK